MKELPGAPISETNNPHKEVLFDIFPRDQLSPWQTDAANIIQGLDLPDHIKESFFLHFLFEEGQFFLIKRLVEIREDYSAIANPFIYDDKLVDIYENSFHLQYRRNRSKESLSRNRNIHDVHDEFEIDRNELRMMRRQLFEEGALGLGLSAVEIAVKKLRDQKLANGEIAKKLGISYRKACRVTSKLVLMGLIDPEGVKTAQITNQTRKYYDKIADLYRSGEIADHDPRYEHVLHRLVNIGEIDSRHFGWSHTPEAIEKIKAARREQVKAPGYSEALSERMKRLMTPAVRDKIAKSQKAAMTDERKKIMSAALKGKQRGHRFTKEEAIKASLTRWGKQTSNTA